MAYAQVYALREGMEVRMEMHAEPDDALKAFGLAR
jgi:hypothetical protein